MTNRRLMMYAVIKAVRSVEGIPACRADMTVVNCHHNYVAREEHYGENVYITHKGAVWAQEGELSIRHYRF
jgi:tRNA-splicing ligase RtcB (3'-phosphate/5'-hydroxy nucleic acid ligase)